MSDKAISKITKEFAKKIVEAKEAFILEEMKPYYDYIDMATGKIVWSQRVRLRLAEYKDWEMQNEQIRKAIISELDDYFSGWLLTDYLEITSTVEEIVNKHFGIKK